MAGQDHGAIAAVEGHSPVEGHRPRIIDRVVSDKLVAKFTFGGSYRRHTNTGCSAITMRAPRDDSITSGAFDALKQIVLASYDQTVGAVDGWSL